MKFSTLLETFNFLSSNGAVNATINKNTIDNIAQIAFNGNSMINVTNVIVNVAIHAMMKRTGFMCLFFCLLIKIPVFPGCQNLYFTESSIRKVFGPTTASSVLRFSVDAPETTIRI